MANFRRARPRARTFPHRGRGTTSYWLHSWPAWHDRIFHTKPRRAKTKHLVRLVLTGRCDPDNAAWPLGNAKPHVYYW